MTELEQTIEEKLIKQLTEGKSQWTYRPDLNDENKLWENIRQILERGNKEQLDGQPLTDKEFEQVKNQLSFPTFYDAAKWLAGENGVAHVSVQRDTKTIQLTVIKRDDIAGGSSVYEVINQYRALKDDDYDIHDQNRRFDVSLLINGIPLIHIELKNRQHSYMDGFRQIKKYIREGKFTGVFSAVQMFVVSNAVDTKYFAAATEDQLNEKFLSGWEDADSVPVSDYLKFASQVLKIPEAHQMVMKYAVLDQENRKLLLLRPYQIHAIEAVRTASRQGKSGYIWHTTGSGKTMTSYKTARNLLMDIPSIEKTIFLIDRKDLDSQTTQAFQSYANNDVVDVDETDNVTDLINKLKNQNQQVIVTTIQKLSIAVKKRLQEGTPTYSRIKNLRIAFVVDECHRAVTPKTQRLLSRFFSHSLWYGFTGTPRFKVNSYPAEGDLPRTTDELYGECLHKYTVKEAIRDQAVLGFQTEHLGPSDLKKNDENEDLSIYETEAHMLKVIDTILNKSREKLGFTNGRGKTYEGLLTVKSIQQAQAYYDLLKRVKNGETSVKISEETKRVLPDFPKFAITYSVSSDDDSESTDLNVPKMKESLDDYNKMFGTSYGIGEIKGYNSNLNDRLARKKSKYKSRDEQLDLVIVVNRLLTGFDAPCLSTVFIDRQPMHPHDIVQTFSRTNRLFDQLKQAGQIVTFQSPHKFKKAVDDALILYSAGGEASVLAPDWDTVNEEFRKALAYLRLTAATPDVIPALSKEGELRFAKAFQEFDKIYANLKAFTKYAENSPEFYGITQEEYDDYAAHYKNIKAKYPHNNGDDGGNDDTAIDFEYELKSYSRERIDYYYIVSLIQTVVSASDEERTEQHYQNLLEEINKYIEYLLSSNPKLGAVMQELWKNINNNPDEFKDKRVSHILTEMRKEAIDNVLTSFAEEWCISLDAVSYSAERYESGDTEIPGLNNLKKSADYNKFSETHNDMSKFKYHQAVKKALSDLLTDEIIPIRDDNYRTDEVKNK
ncbi:MAG: type I restriction endonuclease subunit R [Oscillospiraceae bacterium]|nr:type I restriction endonuclease subunit R [Oscillospiraceae bacterium]